MWIVHKNEIVGGWLLSNGDLSLELTTHDLRVLKTGDRTSVSALLHGKLDGALSEDDLLEIRDEAGGRPFRA
jgi:hypothetical protein